MFVDENFVIGASGSLSAEEGKADLIQVCRLLDKLDTSLATLSCSEPFPFTENLRVASSGAWVTDDLPVTMIFRGGMMVCEDLGCEDFEDILQLINIYRKLKSISPAGSNLRSASRQAHSPYRYNL